MSWKDRVKHMEEITMAEQAAAGGAAPEKKESKKKAPVLPQAKRKRRWLRAVLVLALALAAVAAGKSFLGGQDVETVSSYRLAQVTRREVGVSVSGPATLEPADSYRVSALVSGDILEAPFEELSAVEKGDLLYAIDDSTVRTSVNTASLTVREQELAYRQALDAKSPKAPIGGTVTEVYVKNGDAVNAGDKLLKIVESTDLTADFLFPYVDASAFSAGQKADVFISGYAGSVQGAVESVSDGSALLVNGKEACSVRVKIVNPGALVDGESYTAQAVIGSYTSYGAAKLRMSGAATVCAAGSGTVSGLSKLLGSSVAEGEVLCTLDSEELESRVEAARLSIESARLEVDSAQGSIDGYRITAPISGTVIQKNFKAGDKVDGANSGTLAEIYDLSSLKMEMRVNELDIGKVEVGQTVTLTAAALPGETFTGVVDKVGLAGETTNGFTAYPVTVEVKEYGGLRPGMNVSATIVCSAVKDALCVPVDAVARGNTVLVPGAGALGEDGSTVADETKLEQRNVVLGYSDEGYVQILSGLEEGDTVAYQAAGQAEG